MRTAINVVIILIAAVGIGLVLRSMGSNEETSVGARSAPPLDPAGRDADSPAVVGNDSAHGGFEGNESAAGMSPGAGNDELAETGWMTEFELTQRDGTLVSSRDLRGQPYVVSFFFSTCPSVCKLQNEKLQQLQTEFQGEPVRLLAISVDPEVDTPEVLTEYAKRYKADEDQWLFFTGDMLNIRRVGAEMYGVAVDRKFHTEKFILVGADGKVIRYYRWTDPGQFKQLQDEIRSLIDAGDQEQEADSD